MLGILLLLWNYHVIQDVFMTVDLKRSVTSVIFIVGNPIPILQ